MSGPPAGSRAPYIIICAGRTAEMGATSVSDKIIAVSNCAAQLCAFLETNHGSKVESDAFREVSDLQHELMVCLENKTTPPKKKEIAEKIKQMFKLLYELEDKFE